MHKLFTRQAEASIPTSIGQFRLVAFASDPNDYAPHLAIISKKEPNEGIYNVRLHSECLTGDILGSKRCDCGEQLEMSLAYIAQHGGIILYLRQEGRGIGLINKLKAYALQDKGLDTVEANVHLGFDPDERSYELAMAMLEDLGVSKIRILTNNPDKVEAFNDSEIEIVERIPVEVMPNEINAEYLRVKKDVMGHILGEED